MINEAQFLKLLADYFEKEFDLRVHSEVDRFLLEDPDIRAFFNTLNRTIELCREMKFEEINVPDEIHTQLYIKLQKEITKKKKPGAKKPRPKKNSPT